MSFFTINYNDENNSFNIKIKYTNKVYCIASYIKDNYLTLDYKPLVCNYFSKEEGGPAAHISINNIPLYAEEKIKYILYNFGYNEIIELKEVV
jgi:hypothetical protein